MNNEHPELFTEEEILLISKELGTILMQKIAFSLIKHGYKKEGKFKMCEIWNVDKKELICAFVEYAPLPDLFFLVAPSEKYKNDIRGALYKIFVVENKDWSYSEMLGKNIDNYRKIYNPLLDPVDERGLF